MRIEFKRRFRKDYAKAPDSVRKAFEDRIFVFKRNRYDKSLNNHGLKGDFSSLRSINITGDYRALFTDDGDVVSFIILKNHSNLYR